jgi:rod shape determining protein RodA
VTPLILTIVPGALVLHQPVLGTACALLGVGLGVVFLSGFPLKTFAALVCLALLSCPFGWFFLHDYQKNRILTFLNQDLDPMGTGYHILQSKIAIGSGGVFGKGFLCGSQSKLNFLPEKNTDFIFTTIAEEFGFVGACSIVVLFFGLICYFFWIGSCSKTTFAKLTCSGLGLLLFFHVFINIAMVMGIVPVVGIPLPFLSHGGSSMITFSIGCGLLMSAFRTKRG